MSMLHCVIVRGGRIFLIEAHWRRVKRLLESDFPEVEDVNFFPCSGVIDAGYIVVDYDQKLVLNCQTAFALQDIGFCLTEGWSNSGSGD